MFKLLMCCWANKGKKQRILNCNIGTGSWANEENYCIGPETDIEHSDISRYFFQSWMIIDGAPSRYDNYRDVISAMEQFRVR